MTSITRFSSALCKRLHCYARSRLLSQYKVNSRSVSSPSVIKDEGAEMDAPLKYTTSPAYKWSAETSRSGIIKPRLWYEPYVIIGSLVVFMVYFFILREENHIDKELEKTLYSRIMGLEEHQLRVSLNHNISKGLSTEDIEARLKEIEGEKSQVTLL